MQTIIAIISLILAWGFTWMLDFSEFECMVVFLLLLIYFKRG